MIFGAHFLLYSKEAEADRAFLREVLGFSSIDAGGGWPVFGLPPGEIAVHPSSASSPVTTEDGIGAAALYFMCDDLNATMKQMDAKKVRFANIEEARWGTVTTFSLPSGAKVGLCQPKHPIAFKR
jgi:catechol 2,3-dioxygenase-like lactoylglutathione lyase family enzyme